jgi:hypothetical protein
MPGHCGASGQGGMNSCRCSSGGQALISAPTSGATTWQVSSYALAMVTISVKLFPPNIFHPPKLSSGSI